MKFQKFIEDVQRASGSLRHLDYKALKGEVKRLASSAKCGDVPHDVAALTFAKQLEAELVEVGCSFEVWLWDLKRQVDALSLAANKILICDGADNDHSPLLPLYLLEPLQDWLPVAALADALRQHRLVQITGMVKIEKKFVKVVGVQPRPGFTGAEMLARNALGGSLIHDLCAQLEVLGDKLLQLGLAASAQPEMEDTCSICLCKLKDPARLHCGHRFCIHCILPLFGNLPDDWLDAVFLRCPLCRAAGPEAPQSLCLDSLLAHFGRGLAPSFNLGIGAASSKEERQQFTSIVVSSLARLAAGTAAAVHHSKPHLTKCASGLPSCYSSSQDTRPDGEKRGEKDGPPYICDTGPLMQ